MSMESVDDAELLAEDLTDDDLDVDGSYKLLPTL